MTWFEPGWAATRREATFGGAAVARNLLRVGLFIGQIPGDVNHRDPLVALE